MRCSLSILAALGIATATTSASPTSAAKAKCQNTNVVAGYDTYTVIPGTGELMGPPNPYMSLNYTNFGSANLNLGDLGFAPQSPPNGILYSVTTELTGLPNIVLADKNYKYFAAKSIYVGNSVAGVQADATVAASGLTVGGVRKSTTFRYTATPGNRALQKVVFPAGNFDKLTQLSLTTVSENAAASVTIFDSFAYELVCA